MWNNMLYGELDYGPHLVQSETSSVHSSPWRSALLAVSSGKVFLRIVEREQKSNQSKNSVLNTFKNW